MMSIYQHLLLLLLAFTTCSAKRSIFDQQGCSDKKNYLCCQTKDNSCRVFGARMNNVSSDTCFCDSECEILGDCCTDYHHACELIARRSRHESDQQDESSAATEKKKLRELDVVPGSSELGESARIIPAYFDSLRKDGLYNLYLGINKNLLDHYNGYDVMDHPTYCATFQITSTRKSCRSTFFASWAPKLQKGVSVCVECHPLAMKKKLGMRCHGHGVLGMQTRWNAATVPGCHGQWVMTKAHQECSCNQSSDLSLIFL